MNLTDLRYTTAMERIREIPGENGTAPGFVQYFEAGALWFIQMEKEEAFLASEEAKSCSLDVLRERNHALYREILPGAYEKSYADPAFAARELGEEFGPLLSALRYEIRSVIPFVYNRERERFLIRIELFLEVYTAFCVAYRESGGCPEPGQVRSIIRQYLADYAEEEMTFYQRDRLSEGNKILYEMVMKESPKIRDLYLTGEYVTEEEIITAQFIGSFSDEKTQRIADAVTQGYIRGFTNGGKNIATKKRASVIFHMGFERICGEIARRLRGAGLDTVIPTGFSTLFYPYQRSEETYCGADPNPQYHIDHREDLALFLDDNLQKKRIEGLANAYRTLKSRTVRFAGPVVLETFGPAPFVPEEKKEAPAYSKAQKRMCAEYASRSEKLYDEAVDACNRSFTCIAFPMPSVGRTPAEYEEIFDAVLRINIRDNAFYERAQALMIDVLSASSRLEVKGMNGNRTCLTVALPVPGDPANETSFENCLADVNFPAGEVFTTPVLEGTKGKLHVKGIHLSGLYFSDLELDFEDGMVRGYSCSNFEDAGSCRKYIEDHILFHNRSLPMGECAIGTNTEAYAASSKYGIFDRLPVLIAEKTGPHFAVGDTCYAGEEENHVYNPDGKEVTAKDNSVSILRKTRPGKAYFGCHTDITIPYDEIGELAAVREDGLRIPILEKGRFVLEGTTALNEPLMKQGRL